MGGFGLHPGLGKVSPIFTPDKTTRVWAISWGATRVAEGGGNFSAPNKFHLGLGFKGVAMFKNTHNFFLISFLLP